MAMATGQFLAPWPLNLYLLEGEDPAYDTGTVVVINDAGEEHEAPALRGGYRILTRMPVGAGDTVLLELDSTPELLLALNDRMNAADPSLGLAGALVEV
jgi:hypothetical protein